MADKAGGIYKDDDAALASGVAATKAECEADYQKNTAWRHEGKADPSGPEPASGPGMTGSGKSSY